MSDHIPVLLKEVIHYLDIKPNSNYIDCTMGGAGHSLEILRQNGPDGKVLGIDLDPDAFQVACAKLSKFSDRVILVHDNFARLEKIVQNENFRNVRGILLDLGMSSIELEKSQRGFSFQKDETLDMRFDPNQGRTAAQILNESDIQDLAAIFKNYGEVPIAYRIAQAVIKQRKIRKIQTTQDLVEIIKPFSNILSPQNRIHPATKIFQALRMAVNQELENLEKVLAATLNILDFGGRLVVISFHSLEDRIVKNFLRREASSCLCPPESPICTCNHHPNFKILTKKPIESTLDEIKNNPRARSSRMRVAERK